MFPGEEYTLALGSLRPRVRLLSTPAELQVQERARVRFCEGGRKGEVREVSVHDLLCHADTGRQIARPMRPARPKPPGVRRPAR